MIKLILIILTGVLSIVIIKQLRPEYSFLLRIAVLLTVLFSAVAAFSVLSDKIGESIGDAEINTEGLKLMVKTAGVSVVTEIASAVCRDASAQNVNAELFEALNQERKKYKNIVEKLMTHLRTVEI